MPPEHGDGGEHHHRAERPQRRLGAAGAARDGIDEAPGIDGREQLGERADDGYARDPGDLPGLARPVTESEAENGPERLPPPLLNIERHSVIRRRDGTDSGSGGDDDARQLRQ
ncbi:hypothetical protein D3C87_1818280 [compost metagenome]